MVKDSLSRTIYVQLLGHPQVYRGQYPVQRIKTTKARALLYYLLAESRLGNRTPVPKERLLDLLWPGMPSASGLQNLRQCLYQVRKGIAQDEAEPPLLLSDRKTVWLQPDLEIRSDLDEWGSDAARANMMPFARMEDLLSGEQLPFLQDFHVPDCPAYDEWIDQRRTQLQQQASSFTALLLQHYEQQRAWKQGLPHAYRALTIQPYSDAAAARLIRFLRESAAPQQAIVEYRRYEERLRSELQSSPSEMVQAELPKIPDASPTASAAAVHPQPGNSRSWLLILLVLIPVAFLGLAYWPDTGSTSVAQSGPADSPRIAVLPLQSMAEHQFMAQGLSDDIIAQLTQRSSLQVISRQSTSQYDAARQSPDSIGRALQVDYLLTGSLQVLPEQVRLRLQLHQVKTGTVDWAESISVAPEELYTVQRSVAGLISQRLGSGLSGQPAAPATTRHPGAYEAFLQGRHAFYTILPGGLDTAIAYFERALQLDPSFDLARTWLAWAVCAQAGTWGDKNMQEQQPRVEQLLGEVEGNPAVQAMVHKIRGWMAFWQYDTQEAVAELRRAVTYNPDEEFGLAALAMMLALQGEYEEAIEFGQRSLTRNPHFFWNYFALGQAYYYQGDLQRAETMYQRSLALNPDMLAAIHYLSTIYLMRGEQERALRFVSLEINRVGEEHSILQASLGSIYAAMGDEERALAFAKTLQRRHAAGEKNTAYFAAEIYAGLQQYDRALEWLQEGFVRRDDEFNWLRQDYAFRPMQHMAGFQAILDAMDKKDPG